MAARPYQRFWHVYRENYRQERAVRTAREQTGHQPDALARWKAIFLGCLALAWLLRGARYFLGLPDAWFTGLQYVVGVPMLVAAVIIVATWLRRRGVGG